MSADSPNTSKGQPQQQQQQLIEWRCDIPNYESVVDLLSARPVSSGQGQACTCWLTDWLTWFAAGLVHYLPRMSTLAWSKHPMERWIFENISTTSYALKKRCTNRFFKARAVGCIVQFKWVTWFQVSIKLPSRSIRRRSFCLSVRSLVRPAQYLSFHRVAASGPWFRPVLRQGATTGGSRSRERTYVPYL